MNYIFVFTKNIIGKKWRCHMKWAIDKEVGTPQWIRQENKMVEVMGGIRWQVINTLSGEQDENAKIYVNLVIIGA